MPTRAEWEAKGLELFGEDKTRWVFRCPTCGNEMSIRRAMAEFPELKGKGWAPESECIGRYIDTPVARMAHSGKRCDWCAYGLFYGPVGVEMDDGKIVHAFDFAGEPREAPR